MTFSRLTVAAFSLLLLAGPAWAQDSDEPQDKQPGINSELVSALRFRGIGPAFMSGRIGDIAVDPYDRSIWYVVASSGGVWKTTNAGVTFTPIFDNYGSYSIGCVAIDPNDQFLFRDLDNGNFTLTDIQHFGGSQLLLGVLHGIDKDFVQWPKLVQTFQSLHVAQVAPVGLM